MIYAYRLDDFTRGMLRESARKKAEGKTWCVQFGIPWLFCKSVYL